VGGIVVASSACSVDSLDQTTAPQAFKPTLSGEPRPELRRPPAASPASSVPDMSRDGTYNVNIDPTVANTLVMAGNTLEIPRSLGVQHRQLGLRADAVGCAVRA
jgi:hypothetical protein